MEALSSNLLMYIFEFLSLKDYASLIVTCKDFSNAILNHQKFWVRECLNKHLSFDLELYSEIYDCEDFKSYLRNKILYLQKNSWKQLLEEGKTHKKALASVLNNISPVEDVENFMNDFHQLLKEPNLPMASLKRETVMCTAQTLFQVKLSEVLYEDTGSVNKNGFFFDSSLNIIDELKQIDKQIFQEMLLCDKNEIHKARWYNFEHSELSDLDETISYGDKSDMLVELPEIPDLTRISNVSTEDLQMSKNRSSLLLSLYDNICASFRHHCRVLHKYLSSLDDIYLLVSEYTARWKIYVCSMLEFEKTFAAFTELMNTNYESIFEGYPCFPKFSIWRLMTKIWMREVYEKANLNRILTESFLKILSTHRESTMKEIFNHNFLKTNVEEEEEISDLPKSLFIGLRVMEKQRSFHSQYNANLYNSTPECFKSSPEMERGLLASFLQSVLDISLNEVKIHYLDCTDFPANYPYCELEEAVLYQSNDFYRQYQKLFYESPEYFSHLLKADLEILSKILVEKSSMKLEIIQQQKGVEVIQEFISQKINELDEEAIRKNEKQFVFPNDQEDQINVILESIVGSVLEKQNCCQSEVRNEQFYIESYMEEEKEKEEEQIPKIGEISPSLCKAFTKALIMHLEALPSNFKESLEYIKQRSEHLQEIKQKDECIRYHNIEKNIPCEMGDVDALFYDLDKTIGINLLEKLYEDYQLYARQQKQEEDEKESIEHENNNNNNAENENFGNGFIMQPAFTQDFDNIDLMSLGELSFRRALT